MKLSLKHLYIFLSLAIVPAGLNAYAANAPAGNAAKPVPKAIPLSGKVQETMDGGGYTYILLKNGSQKSWVAVPKMKVSVGQELTLVPGFEIKNFSSKGLNRKFDSVIFSAGVANQQIKLAPEAMKMAHQGMPADQAKAVQQVANAQNAAPAKAAPAPASTKGAKAAPAKKAAPIKVGHVAKAKGPNAYSIAELYAQRLKLEGKPVVVRGKVVKISTRIMKRNWIHIQDGTGSAKKKNNMLVVTSNALPKEGDVITASGEVFNNLDFGYGYKFAVLIQARKLK